MRRLLIATALFLLAYATPSAQIAPIVIQGPANGQAVPAQQYGALLQTLMGSSGTYSNLSVQPLSGLYVQVVPTGGAGQGSVYQPYYNAHGVRTQPVAPVGPVPVPTSGSLTSVVECYTQNADFACQIGAQTTTGGTNPLPDSNYVAVGYVTVPSGTTTVSSTQIAPAASYFGLNVKQSFNVIGYGAQGDIASDTLAINAAIAAMPAAGGILYFPPGISSYAIPTESFNKSIDIACDGAGRTSLILPSGTYTNGLLVWNAQSNVTVQGCTIDATAATNSGYNDVLALSGSGSSNIKIRDNVIKSWGSNNGVAIGLSYVQHYEISGNVISQPSPTAAPNGGIFVFANNSAANSGDGHIFNNIFTDTGMEVQGTDVWIDSNHVTGACAGGSIDDDVNLAVRFHIRGNDIHGCGITAHDSLGYLLTGIEDYGIDSEIVGNYADANSGSGLVMHGNHSRAIGNDFLNNGVAGIDIGTAQTTPTVINSSDDVISGNTIGDTNMTHVQPVGITDTSGGLTNVQIVDNHFFGLTTKNVATAGNTTGSFSGDGVISTDLRTQANFGTTTGTALNASLVSGSQSVQGNAVAVGTPGTGDNGFALWGTNGGSGNVFGVLGDIACFTYYGTSCQVTIDHGGDVGMAGSAYVNSGVIHMGLQPTFTVANGAPTGSCQNGSLYVRSDSGAGAGSTTYDCRANTWFALSGG